MKFDGGRKPSIYTIQNILKFYNSSQPKRQHVTIRAGHSISVLVVLVLHIAGQGKQNIHRQPVVGFRHPDAFQTRIAFVEECIADAEIGDRIDKFAQGL